MIKTFEEYQVDSGQLFEAKAAFNAAVEMCREHYELDNILNEIAEMIEEDKELMIDLAGGEDGEAPV